MHIPACLFFRCNLPRPCLWIGLLLIPLCCIAEGLGEDVFFSFQRNTEADEQSVLLWDDARPLPRSVAAERLQQVEFRVIKPYEYNTDGYRFLHGVALVWHKGKLLASFGHNRGGENTDTEEARYRVSEDGGRSWSDVLTLDAGPEPGVGISHGVFLSHGETLWAFHGAYSGIMQNVHTRAYTLDESTNSWIPRGAVIAEGFWPMNQPIQMEDGNWIMPGIRVGGEHPSAVAISRGEDFTRWDLRVIPRDSSLGKMWGESAVIVSGKEIWNISRYGDAAQALVAHSQDYGRNWSPLRVSNLSMTTSKPCAGLLSTGQRYLISTITADCGKSRAPLTIALSRPGQIPFSKVMIIRPAEFPEGPGESHPRAALAYPCAIEHEGKLYVGYSNNGGNQGRVGVGRELWNNNSAELAIIPLEQLRVE
ncbi:MAG: sialidase family protein [Planctomycetaceae bacterium]|nr:exo-alpha-sialidase [Planctomycetaceae bacterium]